MNRVCTQLYAVMLTCIVGSCLHLKVSADEEKPRTSVKGFNRPLNVTVQHVNSTSIKLTWHRPDGSNEEINEYRLYYIHANYTDVQTIKSVDASPHVEYILSELKPFTEYKIWLKALDTMHVEGASSDFVQHKTDISGPSAPIIMNLTCHTQDALFLQWKRPTNFHNTIDFYYISYRDECSNTTEEIMVETSKEHLESMMLIPNLTANTVYEVKIKGASRSYFDRKLIIHGQSSEPRKVEVDPGCDNTEMFMHSSSRELSAGMIAGAVCASFVLLFACMFMVLWRKCFQAAYYYLDDPPRASQTGALVDWDSHSDSGDVKMGIPTHLFFKHVAELHADGDIGFSKEYEAIQAASMQEEYTSEHSQHPDNKQKNRYLNILAFDHSRVRLLPAPGQKKSIDYINANYIDGYQCSRAYIGTQGPLPTTFECFWRMVWEQRVAIIVMITNLVERGRRKCDMYWPKEGVEMYGVIQVKLVKEDVMATYTVRTLQIQHLRIKKKKHCMSERLVYQYHYTNWPDHGTPDHPLPVLSFVKKSAAANPLDAGPIIVHCSAGVGRTGTYIVLDAMLKQIQSKGEVNIFGFLRHIRMQRNFLVQTEEQYIFIHDSLLEAIDSGETNIVKDHLLQYIQNLQAGNTIDENNKHTETFETQYKNMTSFEPKDFNLISANKPTNQTKNRSLDLLPVESSRVHLTPKPGIDGSDYINASWFQGFQKLREFIVTQHPLENTIQDFWQMIWDHNAQTIVLLSSIEDPEYGIFWLKENKNLDTEHYKVNLIEENDHEWYVTRDFTMQSLQDDYELLVRIIQCANWPQNCTPLSSVFHLLNLVQEWHQEYQNGPIVVIDRLGGTEAAIFCCLTTLRKQLEYENHADVYMYSKLYHNKRPGIWKTQDDFLHLYLCLEAISSLSPPLDRYPTANGHAKGFLGNGKGSVQVPLEGVESLTEAHTCDLPSS